MVRDRTAALTAELVEADQEAAARRATFLQKLQTEQDAEISFYTQEVFVSIVE